MKYRVKPSADGQESCEGRALRREGRTMEKADEMPRETVGGQKLRKGQLLGAPRTGCLTEPVRKGQRARGVEGQQQSDRNKGSRQGRAKGKQGH